MIGQGTGVAHDGGRGHAGRLNNLEVERRAVRQAVIGRGGSEQGQVFAELQRRPLAVGLRLRRVPVLLCRAVQLAVRVTVRL